MFLARLQEFLGPVIIEVLANTLAPAQLRDAVLAAQAIQDDADLLLSRKMPACRAAGVSRDGYL